MGKLSIVIQHEERYPCLSIDR